MAVLFYFWHFGKTLYSLIDFKEMYCMFTEKRYSNDKENACLESIS